MRLSSYGEYFQDVFIIKLNVPIDFNNIANSDDPDHLGTLIHEYFHFMQNISTTFGNISMACFYAKMMNILNVLSKSECQYVKKGIAPNKDIESIVSAQEIALGDMDGWTYERCDFMSIAGVKMERDELLAEYADSTLPQIDLFITNKGKAESKTLNFGAMCIMESMADMFERKLYGRSKDGWYVQYDICESLWRHVFHIDPVPELIFRCCEYSLMYENPGQIFYCGLGLLKRYKDGDEINELLIDKVFNDCIKPNYSKTYCKWYEEMISKFCDLVPSHNSYCAELFEYVMDFCDEFYNMRKNEPLFFTDLFKKESNVAKETFISYMHAGAPLIIDNNDEVYAGINQKEGKIGMEEYASLYALYTLMKFSGNKECILKTICKVYSVDAMDSFCDNDPLMAVSRDKLCTLGQLLYMWQVKPKKICR